MRTYINMSIFGFKLIDFFIFASATTLLCRLPAFDTAMIPELALAAMLTYLLIVVAVELGNGRSKKTLTFEVLNALHDGIGYVIILYAMHLILLGPEILFNGYAHVNAYVYVFKILVAITGRSILLNSEKYIRDSNYNLLEYPLVLSLALLFMLFLVGSSHLISAFISLVGFSLNLYVLVLFDAPHAMAREAGVKYFYLSAFSSGLMLYGAFLIFFTLGTGQFHEMNQAISTNSEILTLGGSTLHCGLAFLLVGIFFKLSAFPGHL